MDVSSAYARSPKILILGAGPTGLGAAYRLLREGCQNWKIIERNAYIGGLCASFQDSHGFVWDIGGHVAFSQYPEFDQFFEEMTSGNSLKHERKSYVRISGRSIPYPLQNNIRHLPPELFRECFNGLRKAARQVESPDRSNFLAWNWDRFGEGITRYFIQPDNEKRWAYPLHKLSADWLADRVSPVDFDRIRDNIRLGRDDAFWKRNSEFKYPKSGGTGAIFQTLAPHLSGRLELESEVVEVNPVEKKVWLANGRHESYDHLLSTLPLDQLARMITGIPPDILENAEKLRHAEGYFVGIGLRGIPSPEQQWTFCPEMNAPFYRVTCLSNLSPFNVPEEGDCSLLCDISHSESMLRYKETIVEETIEGLLATGFLNHRDLDHIVSTYLIDANYTHPVPTLDRDEALDSLHNYLEPLGVHSRGRFGAWLSEAGNMDHCVVMGMQWVDALLHGKRESVWLDRR